MSRYPTNVKPKKSGSRRLLIVHTSCRKNCGVIFAFTGSTTGCEMTGSSTRLDEQLASVLGALGEASRQIAEARQAWQQHWERHAIELAAAIAARTRQIRISTDILILGGGIAGCHAAISAARRGVKVAVVEKAATKRSGSGGAGAQGYHRPGAKTCSRRAVVHRAGPRAGPTGPGSPLRSPWVASFSCPARRGRGAHPMPRTSRPGCAGCSAPPPSARQPSRWVRQRRSMYASGPQEGDMAVDGVLLH